MGIGDREQFPVVIPHAGGPAPFRGPGEIVKRAVDGSPIGVPPARNPQELGLGPVEITGCEQGLSELDRILSWGAWTNARRISRSGSASAHFAIDSLALRFPRFAIRLQTAMLNPRGTQAESAIERVQMFPGNEGGRQFALVPLPVCRAQVYLNRRGLGRQDHGVERPAALPGRAAIGVRIGLEFRRGESGGLAAQSDRLERRNAHHLEPGRRTVVVGRL